MKTKKGFTLVELLIVIAIIGILSSMMMISTTEATDSARVTKIVEGFRSISTAMTMFYADHASSCDLGTDGVAVGKGAAKFLKDTSTITSGDSNISSGKLTAANAVAGKYHICVNNGTSSAKGDQSWWIIYTIPGTKAGTNGKTPRIAEMLSEKAKEHGFMNKIIESHEDNDYYNGSDMLVYMKVR